MSALLSNGVAEVDEEVLNQLKAKHPSRVAAIKLPLHEEMIEEKINEWDDTGYDVEMLDSKQMMCDLPPNHDRLPKTSCKNFPSLIIKADQILTAAKKAKRLTSGGLQQISPWLLGRALSEDTTVECATIAAQVATRWGRGDFTAVLGELVAESQLIALYKDEKRRDVRPISVGCALRRLLTRAYCSQIRGLISSHVQEHTDVIKGVY